MTKEHLYHSNLVWTGVEEKGPARDYRGYSRNHVIRIDGKPDLAGSSDPGFRGDASRHNPEDLLVASLSACHMLWYLHLCTVNGIVVMAYEDHAEGRMVEDADGGGQFSNVTLRPRVTIEAGGDVEKALHLHHDASGKCFIARSMNFPVDHAPEIVLAG